jgi:hypothetical protein
MVWVHVEKLSCGMILHTGGALSSQLSTTSLLLGPAFMYLFLYFACRYVPLTCGGG